MNYAVLVFALVGVWIVILAAKKRIRNELTRVYITASALILALDKARKAKNVWKDYAVAIEALLDVAADICVQSDDEEDQLIEQRDNAKAAVLKAVWRLYDLGEYPDIYESCPFLDGV